MKNALLGSLTLLFLLTFLEPVQAHNKVVVVPLLGGVEKPNPLSVSVIEDAGFITLELQRTGGSEGEVSAKIRSFDGTAKVGQDYEGISTPLTLTWPDGNTTPRTITFPIHRDNLLEGDETFTVSVTSDTPGLIGSRGTITVIIKDDPPGRIQFNTNIYGVREGSGFITIQLQRVGGDGGQISVDIQSFDGTAKNGQDYNGINAPLTFTWPDSNANNRTVTFPILGDSILEFVETFTVSVTSTNPDWLGAPKVATVRIVDYFKIPIPGQIQWGL